MDTSAEKLEQSLNLSKYEARLYIAALNTGPAPLSTLARSAQIPRTATYPPLQSLLKKGLFSVINIGKRVHYQAIEPTHLRTVLEKQKNTLEAAIGELSQIIDAPTAEVSVRYFPGTYGIERAADIFLEEAKTRLWKSFENPEHVLEKMGEEIFDAFIARRVKKKIKSRIITPGNPRSPWVQKRIAEAEKDLNDIVLVSPSNYPIRSTVALADDMIFMIDANVTPFAILIKNAGLAQTLESVHDIIWNRYRPNA
ncbi:MAG TPA: helix-turn-helix domain-containing protein [Candidatus Paceibacterota bacterium]